MVIGKFGSTAAGVQKFSVHTNTKYHAIHKQNAADNGNAVHIQQQCCPTAGLVYIAAENLREVRNCLTNDMHLHVGLYNRHDSQYVCKKINGS